jgi:hypothetical protein
LGTYSETYRGTLSGFALYAHGGGGLIQVSYRDDHSCHEIKFESSDNEKMEGFIGRLEHDGFVARGILMHNVIAEWFQQRRQADAAKEELLRLAAKEKKSKTRRWFVSSVLMPIVAAVLSAVVTYFLTAATFDKRVSDAESQVKLLRQSMQTSQNAK